jgi:hypothetical protein
MRWIKWTLITFTDSIPWADNPRWFESRCTQIFRTQGGYMSIAGVNLEGKTVLIRKSFFKPEYADGDRRFKCESGFGCDPSGSGTKVYGTFLLDGEEAWVRRSDVESVEAK